MTGSGRGFCWKQRREPFLEVELTSRTCRLLTLFAARALSESCGWEESPEGWSIEVGEDTVRAACDEQHLSLRHETS